MLSLKTNKN